MPRIIGDTLSNASVRLSYQRKLFKRQGKYYLFWGDQIEDERKLFYRLADSVDGLKNAPEREATSHANSLSQYGNYYDLHYDRHRDRVGVAWVKRTTPDSRELFFKYGTFGADGVIQWQNEHQVDERIFSEFRDPVLGQSASGKWGIFLKRYDGSTYEACFYSCNNPAPTATNNWSDRGNLPPGTLKDAYRSHRICQVGSSGDDLLLIYKVEDDLAAQRWNGSGLGPAKRLAVDIKSQIISGAVVDSRGDVHVLCFNDKGDYRVKQAVYRAGADEWDSEIADFISPAGKYTASLALQIDGQNHLHALFKYNSLDTTPERLYYFKRAGSGWQEATSELPADAAAKYRDLRETPTVAFFDETELLVAWINETEEERNEVWMAGIAVAEPDVKPVADFSADKTSGHIPLTVQFSDTSQPGSRPLSSWEWDFGDGQTSSEQHPQHTYESPGNYTVKLTVSDGKYSDSKIAAEMIRVAIQGPVANFQASPTSGAAPLKVKFTDTSQAGSLPLTSWEWDFGDGQTSSEQHPQHSYAAPGEYTVRLTVSDGTLSDSKSAEALVRVEAVPPRAAFSAEPTGGDAPLEVSFSEKAQAGTNPITSWEWNFGDGTTSAERNPVHTYQNAGTYTVQLTVSDGQLSDTEQQVDYIKVEAVQEAPRADFGADPNMGIAPLKVKFSDTSQAGTNPITSWEWDFGDGNSSSEQHPQHTYQNPGTYTVKLTVSDGQLSDSKVGSELIQVAEAEAPRADFGVDPNMGIAPLEVKFSDTSQAGSNPITSWEWDFGDGNSSSEQHPRHTYQDPGTYTVKLTVSDGQLSDSKVGSELIQVAEAEAPRANFTAEPSSGTVPLKVKFSDTSQAGSNPITSWEWAFGDGNSSSEQHPQHTYSVPGTYTVKLTVSDGNLSNTRSKSEFITVKAVGPTADFTADKTHGTAPLVVNFSDQSQPGTNPITSRQWDFGDGQVDTGKHPQHRYDRAGRYSVKLTVSDGELSDTKTKSQFITVEKPVDECWEGRYQSMLCYLFFFFSGIVGWALGKNRCVRFHGLQSFLTFLLIGIVMAILRQISPGFTPVILAIAILTLFLWLLLMFKALQGKRYKLPLIGDFAERAIYKNKP